MPGFHETEIAFLGPEDIISQSIPRQAIRLARRIATLPGAAPPVCLTSECHVDSMGRLTGILLRTTRESRLVYSCLIPDIGCGYLVMHIKRLALSTNHRQRLANLLVNVAGVLSPSRRRETKKYDGRQILARGTTYLRECGMQVPRSSFQTTAANSIHEVLVDRAREALGCAWGHFCEVRAVDEILDVKKAEALDLRKSDDIVIIHAGAHGLPLMVRSDDMDDVCQLRHAAWFENFARCSRLIAANSIRRAIVESYGLGDEDVRILSDVCHSGIGEEGTTIVHARGIQPLFGACSLHFDSICQTFLIAGTCLTPSFLVTPIRATPGLLPHGSPEIRNADPAKEVPVATVRSGTVLADSCLLQDGLPLATERIVEHFFATGVAAPLCLLAPRINLRNGLGGELAYYALAPSLLRS